MKKTVFLTFLLTGTCFAQSNLIDFEELTFQGASEYWNGDDLSGGFQSGTAQFNNYYDTTYYYWSGFAYSKVKDSVTAGYGNQYASYANGGADTSANYAVWYGDGAITFDHAKMVSSLAITNDTYTAISMRDGDTYGKKFGDSTDANGQQDGTNGADWFKVTIIAWADNGDSIGATEFYLADYRFANSAQDYIVNTWQQVDLSSFGWIKKITFETSSSDTGQFGMNTPNFFCLDNIEISQATLGIAKNETANISIYPNPAADIVNFSFSNEEDRTITLLSSDGKIAATTQSTGVTIQLPVQHLAKGLYLCQIQGKGQMISKPIILQ